MSDDLHNKNSRLVKKLLLIVILMFGFGYALVPLYDGADCMEDTIGYLRGLGYAPIDTLPTFHHRDTGHLMQMDVLFLRQA